MSCRYLKLDDIITLIVSCRQLSRVDLICPIKSPTQPSDIHLGILPIESRGFVVYISSLQGRIMKLKDNIKRAKRSNATTTDQSAMLECERLNDVSCLIWGLIETSMVDTCIESGSVHILRSRGLDIKDLQSGLRICRDWQIVWRRSNPHISNCDLRPLCFDSPTSNSSFS